MTASPQKEYCGICKYVDLRIISTSEQSDRIAGMQAVARLSQEPEVEIPGQTT